MLKIIERSQDKLVLKKIPLQYYLLDGLIIASGIIIFLILLNRIGLGAAILSSAGFLLAAFLCLRIAGTATLIVINKSKQALYYQKKGLFLNKIKKYYFFEIQGFRANQNNTTDSTPNDHKSKQGVFLQKSTGSYKLLVATRDKDYADRLTNVMNDYLLENNIRTESLMSV